MGQGGARGREKLQNAGLRFEGLKCSKRARFDPTRPEKKYKKIKNSRFESAF